jgi:hypothetical protein
MGASATVGVIPCRCRHQMMERRYSANCSIGLERWYALAPSSRCCLRKRSRRAQHAVSSSSLTDCGAHDWTPNHGSARSQPWASGNVNECPLWVRSRHSALVGPMAALRQKRTFLPLSSRGIWDRSHGDTCSYLWPINCRLPASV